MLYYIIGYVILCVITSMVLCREDFIDPYDWAEYLIVGVLSLCSPVVIPVALLGYSGKWINEWREKCNEKS